jgi:hypothetical protein
MKRRRDDSIKGGKGIDNGLGERFGKTDVVSPWADHHGGNAVGEIDPASQMPAADENRDIQFMWASRDIMTDVEANQNPNGEFDSTGPIKAGVNRRQDQ